MVNNLGNNLDLPIPLDSQVLISTYHMIHVVVSARMLIHLTEQTQAGLYICNIILHSVSQNCIVCVREEIFFVKMSFQPIFNK